MRSPAEQPAPSRALLRTLVLTIGLVPLIFVAVPPASAETIQSDLVLIRDGDVISEDLYAVANRIEIDGVVRGDLLAAAFGEVRVGGLVEGSVIVVASSVVITGEVTGSLRVVSPEVVIEGEVGRDVATAAAELTATETSTIGRDVIGAAWRAELDGSVGRGVEATIRSLEIDGPVAGSVEVAATSLSVGPDAVIAGDLIHRTSGDAEVHPSARIEGSELAQRPLAPNVRVVGLGLLLRVLLVVFAAALGLTVVWASVRRSEEAAEALRSRPAPAAATGVGVVALPLLIVAVLAVVLSLTPPESAIPLVLAALPLLVGVVGLIALGALLSPVPLAILIGDRLLGDRSTYARFLVGFLVVAGLALIPVVGRWLLAGIVVLGLGAWLVRA